MQNHCVFRKAGWDTHGLPVELQVEKELGITKEDIGKKISIAAYNQKCKESVMRFRKEWELLTQKMGFWIDMSDPYITYDKKYIESVWWILKQLYEKNLLYKGHAVQPYSPAAGSALSQHELNQPGCYKEIKDLSVVAQFRIRGRDKEYFLAWTTTPWTLPSNHALALNKDLIYWRVRTKNPHTNEDVVIILAKDRVPVYLKDHAFEILDEIKGAFLVGLKYEPLFSYVEVEEPAFMVIEDSFVTTEEGTGIVHIAKHFGTDDHRVSQKHNMRGVVVRNEQGEDMPLVDKQGRFVPEVKDFAGRYVKDFGQGGEDTDKELVLKLKRENKVFKAERYLHNYPHCWRTDKPVLYYPMSSWFIRTSAVKKDLMALNETICWHPSHVGSGRFGHWLENVQDWNLSRSRFWGTPLPIWLSQDKQEVLCIGSYEELAKEVKKSVKAGFMSSELRENFDPHRPFVDDIVLCSPKGEKMYREPEVIDVWFDSGAMPYAQWHYPFENEKEQQVHFPADFIAEGIDQTRGWFFTLHALSVMLRKKIAFKHVFVNGLVLDKKGHKMSKRLGNAVDPMKTLSKYGADATRWYLMGNTSAAENTKFDETQLQSVQRSFFGTLCNVFNFFVLYANIDQFVSPKKSLPADERTLADQWLLSRLQELITNVKRAYENYEPHLVVRTVQPFVIDELSNWYVRLNRKRFWQSENNVSKRAAYQTLYETLRSVLLLIAPTVPFLSEKMYQILKNNDDPVSVHLHPFPKPQPELVKPLLNERMAKVQRVCSLAHAIRKKHQIKVRQPLNTLSIPVPAKDTSPYDFLFEPNPWADMVKQEVNVKALQPAREVRKQVRPNFKRLGQGPYKKHMKAIQAYLQQHPQLSHPEQGLTITLPNTDSIRLKAEDLVIHLVFPEGHQQATQDLLTVALDLNLDEKLKQEGMARELVNRLQHLRKEKGFAVEDKVILYVQSHPQLDPVLNHHQHYICREVQVLELHKDENISNAHAISIEDVTFKADIVKAKALST